MTPKRERRGGLRVDPAVAEWQRTAAENVAALSRKQRRDRRRVRVRLDMPPGLKERIEAAAQAEGTSVSQLGAFLLNWLMAHYEDPESEIGGELRARVEGARAPSRSMKIEWNLEFEE